MITAVVAASLFFVLNSMVSAQQAPILVGVLDTMSVIQKHPIVTDQVSLMEQSFQKEVLEFQKFQQAATKKAEEISNTYKIGTAEYDEQLRPLRDQVRNTEIQLQEKQAKLAQELNKLRFKIHSDIQECVQAVCQQKGILIVFTKIKTPRKGISEEMAVVRDADSNFVMWNRPECDITQDVIAALAQRVGVSKTTPGGALSNLSGNLTPSGPRAQGQPGSAAGSLMNIGNPQQQLPAGNR